MTAKPGDPELRFRVIEAFSKAYNDRQQVEVARIIGSSNSHAHRARDEIRRYGGLEVLDLAIADDDLRRALIIYINGGDVGKGNGTAAVRDCVSMLVDCGHAVQEIGTALADSDISPGEARTLVKTFEALKKKLGEYISDLAATADTLKASAIPARKGR